MILATVVRRDIVQSADSVHVNLVWRADKVSKWYWKVFGSSDKKPP